jgi:hypothetical protein
MAAPDRTHRNFLLTPEFGQRLALAEKAMPFFYYTLVRPLLLAQQEGERELLAAYRAFLALLLALYRPPEPPTVQ